jgi:hypothetical protein
MADFSVDTDKFDTALAAFQELSDRISGTLTGLTSSLDAIGTPWGTDRSGQTFLETYSPTQDGLLAGLRSAATSMQDAAQGLDTMSTGFTGTEELNVSTARSLTPETPQVPAEHTSTEP